MIYDINAVLSVEWKPSVRTSCVLGGQRIGIDQTNLARRRLAYGIKVYVGRCVFYNRNVD